MILIAGPAREGRRRSFERLAALTEKICQILFEFRCILYDTWYNSVEYSIALLDSKLLIVSLVIALFSGAKIVTELKVSIALLLMDQLC